MARAVAAARKRRDSRVLGAVRSYPLAAFFVLAIGLSWSYWIPDVLAGGHWSHFPGLIGPALAAAVVSVLIGVDAGQELWARTSRLRVAPRWYAAALAPLAVAAAVLVAEVLFGGGITGSFSRVRGLPEVGWLGVAGLALVINGFGEEVGWRGFAWPRLRADNSLVRAAVVLAVPWAIWHLPLFWIDSGMRGFAIAAFPGFVFSLACGAVVLGWLVERSRAVVVVALWHTMLNMATATDATESAAPFVSVAVIAMALLVARDAHHGPPPID